MPSVADERKFIVEQLAERIPKLDLEQLRRVQDFVERLEKRTEMPKGGGPSLLDQ